MKEILKVFILLVTGLFVAVLVYPFIHEAGHCICTFLVGAKITDVNLLPIPYVVCETKDVSVAGQMIIGLGGMTFPVLFCIHSYKHFLLRFCSLLLSLICAYSFVLSLVGIIGYCNGLIFESDDVVRVLMLSGDLKSCLIFSVLGLIFSLIIIVKKHPIKQIKVHFFP